MQPDSIVPDLYNPQALNRYAYTLNNPVKYTDPTGRDVGCHGKDASACIWGEENKPPAETDGGNGLKDVERRFDADQNRVKSPINKTLDDLLFTVFPPAKRARMFAWAAFGIFFGSNRGQSASDLSYVVEHNLQGALFTGTVAPVPLLGPGSSLSLTRFPAPGETFYRYESPLLGTRVTSGGGLEPNTYVAPASDGLVPVGGLNDAYKLPLPAVERTQYYVVSPGPNDVVVGPKPVAGGTGNEAVFPFGTSCGTVCGPFRVPR